MQRQYDLRSGFLGGALARALLAIFTMVCIWKSAAAGTDAEEVGMTSAASQIAGIVDPFLKQSGFVRSGLRWYHYEDQSVLVIDVQPARYSPGPYINMGVYYFKYGNLRNPKIVDCHVDTGLTSVVPNPLRGDELLDVSNDISIEVRRSELEVMLRSYALPWLESMARLDAAKAVLADNPTAAHVAPIARADLKPVQ